jgi:putative endonuclease
MAKSDGASPPDKVTKLVSPARVAVFRTGLSAHAVTPRRQARIIEAAQAWLMAHPEHAEFEIRFDGMLIAPRRLPRHLLAAFDAST